MAHATPFARPPRILVVTPVASHPQNQGNSARIFSLMSRIRAAGARVHMLYYTLDGLNAAQAEAMSACWDLFVGLPCHPPRVPPRGNGEMGLDDWFHDSIGDAATRLHRRYRYDAVIVNYVWMSAVLERFGAEVLKIIDTHDLFGDRHARLASHGLRPAWFSTTVGEEAAGLARADIVIAIQPEEARHFESLGLRDVRIVGHIQPQRPRRPWPPAECPRIGYFASGNPLNRASLGLLAEALRQQPIAPQQARFVVAGSICRTADDYAPFERLGEVGPIDDFYEAVDVVVNPMSAGTGLKIKSVEAVCQGLPLVATSEAMIGLQSDHAAHRLAQAEGVAEWLRSNLAVPARMAELAEASWQCGADYVGQVMAQIDGLNASLAQRL